jgi:hypothetical protein
MCFSYTFLITLIKKNFKKKKSVSHMLKEYTYDTFRDRVREILMTKFVRNLYGKIKNMCIYFNKISIVSLSFCHL